MPLLVGLFGPGVHGISRKARAFIARKIRFLIVKEKFEPRRAVAAAFSMARKKGYKVPKAPSR